VRVFPLSNWTELDIWSYIAREGIEVPSIYYSHQRPVFDRDGMVLAVTPWTPPRDDESVRTEWVRYRTVGDATCTGAVRSLASDADEVILETAAATVSERGATRADDRASEAAMEDRKRQGYF
jgi:sulfate adenylyltransferase subunit 2